MGAIYFGDENEDAVTNGLGETLSLKKLLEDGAASRHLEELGTEPRVWYLPPRILPSETNADQGAAQIPAQQG